MIESESRDVGVEGGRGYLEGNLDLLDQSSNFDQKPPVLDEKNRSKSALRIRYEAEAEVIKRKLGNLETIRQTLGLSQRKVCQLLLVDPSAWSRWIREDDDAPPHIYRMLQWYLALLEKYPALDANFWLATVTRAQDTMRLDLRDEKLARVPEKIEDIALEVRQLRLESQNQKSLIRKLTILSLVSIFLAIAAAVALIARV